MQPSQFTPVYPVEQVEQVVPVKAVAQVVHVTPSLQRKQLGIAFEQSSQTPPLLKKPVLQFAQLPEDRVNPAKQDIQTVASLLQVSQLDNPTEHRTQIPESR